MPARTPVVFKTPEGFTTPDLRRIPTLRSAATDSTVSVHRVKLDLDDHFDFDGTTFGDPEEYIKRFIDVGDFDSAVYWIDNSYAKVTEADVSRDAVKFARYLKLLTQAQQFLRVSSIMETGEKFYTQHIVFAYFYVNALFRRKMYARVIGTQIAHLIGVQDTPVRAPVIVNGMDASLCVEHMLVDIDQKVQLDQMADDLLLQSGILLILGQAFLFVENRDSAATCLRKALMMDRYCIKAEQLLVQYKLLEADDELELRKLTEIRKPLESENDPRIMTSRAKLLYARGDPKGAIGITSGVLRAHGWYMDCIIVHVNSLAQLEDSDNLYTFAHQMVEAMAEHEYSWYAVGLYYYTCKKTADAKNYMNKATLMNSGFGDGWLALGHILAADSDNDQALSCYYRAARIMEKNFEPSLYIAMQYCKTGVKLAESFLRDAARIAPENPIVYQEQGCIAYGKKDFIGAIQLFDRALKLVIVEEDVGKLKEFIESTSSYLARKRRAIDSFWAPLLNNLGHCCRRVGYHEQARIYHQAALLIQPRNCQALCSSAMVLFVSGHHTQAIQQIHRALSYNPYDENVRLTLDAMMHLESKKPDILEDPKWDFETAEDLEEILADPTPEQLRAAERAKEFMEKSEAVAKHLGRKTRSKVLINSSLMLF